VQRDIENYIHMKRHNNISNSTVALAVQNSAKLLNSSDK